MSDLNTPTKEELLRYQFTDGGLCPSCSSEDTETDGLEYQFEKDGSGCHEGVIEERRCLTCHSSWMDEYAYKTFIWLKKR